MEHEGSWLCSQEPATGPYPEPDLIHTPKNNFPKINLFILPSMLLSSEWSLLVRLFDQNFVRQLKYALK
jgi:hypothetical protein